MSPSEKTPHRLDNVDYRARRIYHITMTTVERRPLLGCLLGNTALPLTAYDAPRIFLFPLGRAVERCLHEIPVRYPEVRILAYQFMPDHLHLILFITEDGGQHLGRIIRGFKQGCNKAARDLFCGDGIATPTTTVGDGALVAPTALVSPFVVFNTGYYETPLSGQDQLRHMIDYVKDNPRRLLIKREHSVLFRPVPIQFPISSPNPSSPSSFQSPSSSPCLLSSPCTPSSSSPSSPSSFSPSLSSSFQSPSFSPSPLSSPCTPSSSVVPDPAISSQVTHSPSQVPVPPSLSFTAVGNTTLLSAPLRIAVRISRRIGPTAMQEALSKLLEAARGGAILISPCISPGEKAVRDAVLSEHLPYIRLDGMGFSPYYKPVGYEMEAVAASRLLILAPWPYSAQRLHLNKADFEALNSMAKQLATMQWNFAPHA